MDVTRRRAARLRGVFVGAIAAASAVAGHALGGAELPGGTAIVLVVLSTAGVGAVSAAVDPARRIVAVLAYLGLGQLVGHCVLEFSSVVESTGGHHHAHGWHVPMAAAHVVTAAAAAALICMAERLFAVLATVVWQMVILLPMPDDGMAARSVRGRWRTRIVPVRGAVERGCGTRAPPALLRT